MHTYKRSDKLKSFFKKRVAEFLAEESLGDALITVTNISLSNDLHKGTIFISIYPENKEEETLDLLEKNKKALGGYLIENSKMKFIPSFSFEIDKGEKNSMRVASLLAKDDKI